MQEMVNCTVDCDVARLNIPLRPWFARQGHGFVVKLRRIPADVSGVFVRVYTSSTEYTDVAAEGRADGSWLVRVSGTAFPAAAERKYEVHGVAVDDEPCAIGEGRVCVQAFSQPPSSN